MDRKGFFKQGLSSVMEAVQSVIGLKKAAESFNEAIDDALRDVTPEIGLYLPSLDAAMYDSPSGTLYEVGQMGYKKVESGCYYEGTSYREGPAEIKRLAASSGLKIEGLHLNRFYEKQPATTECSEENTAQEDASLSEECRRWWNKALDCARDMGCRRVIMSQFPAEVSAKSIAEYAEYFGIIALMAAERGLQFCFHPTAAELRRGENGSVMDQIAELNDAVLFELDTYEAKQAGVDIDEVLNRHHPRIAALHLHDYGITGESGEIDFDKIIGQSYKYGIRELFVEISSFPLPPQNCAERSLRYVERLDSVLYK